MSDAPKEVSYRRVWLSWWDSEVMATLRDDDDQDAISMAAYLMTGHGSSDIGFARRPLAMIADALGMPFGRASEALAKLSRMGFARYDEKHRLLWVVETARHEWGAELKLEDKRVQGLAKRLPRELGQWRKSPLLKDFLEKYGPAWWEILPDDLKPLARAPEGLPKGSGRARQVQETGDRRKRDRETGNRSGEAEQPAEDRSRAARGGSNSSNNGGSGAGSNPTEEEIRDSFSSLAMARAAACRAIGREPGVFRLTEIRTKRMRQLLRDYGPADLDRAWSALPRSDYHLGRGDHRQRGPRLSFEAITGANERADQVALLLELAEEPESYGGHVVGVDGACYFED